MARSRMYFAGSGVVIGGYYAASVERKNTLTLRQADGEGTWYGVDIAQGRLLLEGRDIAGFNQGL